MSILLDALRKSEAQRQLGSTPTLQSPGGGEVSADGGNRIWIPAAMLLLTAAVIAWIGIKQFQHVAPSAEVAVSTPGLNQQAESDVIEAPEQSDKSGRSARTPVMDFAAEKAPPAPQAQSAADTSVQADSRADPALAKPVSDAEHNPGPGADSEPRSDVPRTPEQTLAARANATRPRQSARNRDTQARQKRADSLEPYESQSISYWQIPQSVRDGMPELHITVLVYAQNPEERFLLVNGQRLREKEELIDGLVLEEIQRQQAIFSYRDYRFYLKN